MNNNVIQINSAKHDAWQGILTERQAEVAELVAQGYTSSHIAATLFVEEQTVKFHLSAVYARLGFSKQVGVAQRVLLARWWWTHIERKIDFTRPSAVA